MRLLNSERDQDGHRMYSCLSSSEKEYEVGSKHWNDDCAVLKAILRVGISKYLYVYTTFLQDLSSPYRPADKVL